MGLGSMEPSGEGEQQFGLRIAIERVVDTDDSEEEDSMRGAAALAELAAQERRGSLQDSASLEPTTSARGYDHLLASGPEWLLRGQHTRTRSVGGGSREAWNFRALTAPPH